MAKKKTAKEKAAKETAAKEAAAKNAGSGNAPPKQQIASLYSDPKILPEDFVASIQKLESALGKNILLVVHLAGPKGINYIHPGMLANFVRDKAKLSRQNAALLVDSPGGIAEIAYRISRLLQRQCEGFTAIVPRLAKSAATLLVLGAEDIIMGDDAELGPLDAQYLDFDIEEDVVSALDTVQAVERLEENASQVAVNMLEYLKQTTRKSYNILMKDALHFAADITRPLFESVDAIRYTRQARILKEAQDYAERLLQFRGGKVQFTKAEAKAIASALVSNYPSHGFVIDRSEAAKIAEIEDEPNASPRSIGLHVSKPPNAEAHKEIDWLCNNMNAIVSFGYLADATTEKGVSL